MQTIYMLEHSKHTYDMGHHNVMARTDNINVGKLRVTYGIRQCHVGTLQETHGIGQLHCQ